MTGLLVFAAGLLFALGLGISGMTQPAKVLAFLDVGGDWDASLMGVMGSAVVAHALTRWWIIARGAALDGSRFALPARTQIDGRLLAGAVVFGIGWGLGGYCPGPAITALAGGSAATVIFVSCMLLGMLAFRRSPWAHG